MFTLTSAFVAGSPLYTHALQPHMMQMDQSLRWAAAVRQLRKVYEVLLQDRQPIARWIQKAVVQGTSSIAECQKNVDFATMFRPMMSQRLLYMSVRYASELWRSQ